MNQGPDYSRLLVDDDEDDAPQPVQTYPAYAQQALPHKPGRLLHPVFTATTSYPRCIHD